MSHADPRPKTLIEFNEKLYRDVPLAKTMGVTCLDFSQLGVSLRAPLSININHRGTVFGGSLFSVAALSCWTLVNETIWANGFEEDSVVVREGDIQYLKPVAGDFKVTSAWGHGSQGDERANFLASLKSEGRARGVLRAEIQTFAGGTETLAVLKARFAVRLRASGN